MKLAFYKGFKSKNIIDWIIGTVTLSKYTHVELVYGDNCFSSSIFDGGVREKVIDFNEHPGRWDIFEIKMTSLQSKEFLKFVEMTKDYDYDLLGIILIYLFRIFNVNRKNKTFCSKWVLDAVGILTNRKHYSSLILAPGSLYKFLKKEEII